MQIGYKLFAEGFSPKEIVRQAVRAEEAGFDFVEVTGWGVLTELSSVRAFEGATAFVRPEDVGGGFGLGPEVDAHLTVVRQFADAGYDRLALINAGPDPDGFLDFFAAELSGPVRALAG